ncbi:PepSY domain-containing protein, partial [Pseudomonas viridiflava]
FQTAQINPYDGEVAAAHLLSDRSKLEFVTESMRPLHTGDFGGIWIKLIWAFFGLVMSMMVLSGLLIWTKRTALATLNALKREAKTQNKPVSIPAMQ